MIKQTMNTLLLGMALATPTVAQDGIFGSLQEDLSRAQLRYAATPENRLDQAQIEALAEGLTRAAGSAFERTQSTDVQLTQFRNPHDSSSMLEIRGATGEILFNDGFAELRTETSTPGLPSSMEAAGIATRLLNGLGLLPDNQGELRIEHVGGIRMGARQDDGSTAIYDKLVTVRFSREIDGLPVHGPGSRIVVRMGENGRLAGVIHRWQTLRAEALSVVERLGAHEIQSLVLERMRQMSRSAVDSELTSVDIVLYDDGQGVVEPAVLVQGTLTIEGRREAGQATTVRFENPVDFYVPIVRDSKAVFPFVKDRSVPEPSEAPIR